MNTMKQIIPVFLCLLLVGCTGTPVSNAGKTLVTIAKTVDAAMSGFATWVAVKEKTAAPVKQEVINQVELTHSRYRQSMEIAKLAYVNASNNSDMTAWNIALASLEGCKTELLNLIATINK